MMKSSRLIIGLMSGTSVDAIDAALVQVSGRGPRYRATFLAHREHAWPKELRQRLLAAMAPADTTTQEICQLNFLVAREFSVAVRKILASQKLTANKITALASHGQTLCHLPVKNAKHETRNAKQGSTLQIGDASVLATLVGITTVANFRPADMAVGGQGAPLVPWTDAILLSHPSKVRCVQNIGGIANVTFLPMRSAASGDQRVVAFDTGPGNMAIDAVVSHASNGKQRYDKNGRLAAKGTVDAGLLRKLQGHPYFSRRPPKSTGREEFGLAFAQGLLKIRGLKLETLLHTLTRLTAWSIADAYQRFLPRMPDEVILCGGGADNPVLTAMLREELGAGVALRRIDEFGIPNKAKEAASFALLAAATLDGIPANLPGVTGAERAVILGVIAPVRKAGLRFP